MPGHAGGGPRVRAESYPLLRRVMGQGRSPGGAARRSEEDGERHEHDHPPSRWTSARRLGHAERG